MRSKRLYLIPLTEALLVTFLWSSSYVLIKVGLREIPPLAFAAIRYSLAFAVLVIVGIIKREPKSEMTLNAQDWLRLIIMGVAGYAGAQGLQFVGLYYLPAITTTFLLNFTPIFVVLLGAVFLREFPAKIQVVGIVVALIGAYLYSLTPIQVSEIRGIFIVLISGFAWAIYMIMTRNLQRTGKIGTLKLTTITIGAGTIVLLVSAIILEGVPSINLSGWAIIIWLSLVNTAFAFYLWNHTLKALKAYELSILQNTMLVQIALLAWAFLGEQLTINMTLGIALVLLGVSIVQIYEIQFT